LAQPKTKLILGSVSEGDLVLIDTTSKKIETNSMYVVQFWGSLQIKRVQRKLDGTVVIKSDNNIYEPEIVPIDQVDNLNVIGRVVWYGKRP
jgi:phage repressor protein C with HTH and peptisase S24 domain